MNILMQLSISILWSLSLLLRSPLPLKRLKNGQQAISLYGAHTHLHINPSGAQAALKCRRRKFGVVLTAGQLRVLSLEFRPFSEPCAFGF